MTIQPGEVPQALRNSELRVPTADALAEPDEGQLVAIPSFDPGTVAHHRDVPSPPAQQPDFGLVVKCPVDLVGERRALEQSRIALFEADSDGAGIGAELDPGNSMLAGPR